MSWRARVEDAYLARDAAPVPPREATPTCVMESADIFTLPPVSEQELLGSEIEGYEILGAIGAGGMGVVMKARHKQLNRIVALKVLGRDALTDPDSRRRFQVEAETVARLQHPNIIQVFDVGTFEDRTGFRTPYLSLEYVDGGSLYRFTYTPQSPAHAAQMVEKLA